MTTIKDLFDFEGSYCFCLKAFHTDFKQNQIRNYNKNEGSLCFFKFSHFKSF